MSVFTPVNKLQLSTLLEDYDLGELSHFENITHGTDNSNFFVHTQQNKFVLTIFEHITADKLNFYISLMDMYRAANLPVAKVMRDQNNCVIKTIANKSAILFECLPGQAVIDVNEQQVCAIVKLLAKMHQQSLSLPAPQNPYGASWHKQAIDTVLPKLLPDEKKQLQQISTELASVDFSKLRTTVIHADIFRDNVLFMGNTIGGIIDFYFATEHTPLIDLSIVILDWCQHSWGCIDSNRANLALNTYQELHPLDRNELSMIPMVLKATAFRFWLSRLYAKHTLRDGENITIKDPEEFRLLLDDLDNIQLSIS